MFTILFSDTVRVAIRKITYLPERFLPKASIVTYVYMHRAWHQLSTLPFTFARRCQMLPSKISYLYEAGGIQNGGFDCIIPCVFIVSFSQLLRYSHVENRKCWSGLNLSFWRQQIIVGWLFLSFDYFPYTCFLLKLF